ncbi:MAG: DUF6314 family protein, partial [Pseudomonadota bacterium]
SISKAGIYLGRSGPSSISSPNGCAMRTDAAVYFAGRWRLTRRIGDRRLGRVGRMTGDAAVTPDGAGGFVFAETGRLVFGDHAGPAERLYRLRDCVGPQATLTDDADIPLARFDLTAPRTDFTHRCPPDVYLGRFTPRCDDAWRLVWRVTGPRKDLVIATQYRRLGEEG